MAEVSATFVGQIQLMTEQLFALVPSQGGGIVMVVGADTGAEGWYAGADGPLLPIIVIKIPAHTSIGSRDTTQ